MKRVVTFLLVFFVFISFSYDVYGANSIGSSSQEQQKIFISIKPDISVELNGAKQRFSDAYGRSVYPVIYAGSSYLPVRALSGLLNKPIEWDSASKTIYIGKTLSNPGGTGLVPNSASNQISTSVTGIKPQYVAAYLKPDILIMYDFVPQTFWDSHNKTVYPIIYNGTTYLPVRGISEMMDKTIEWDAINKKVCICDRIDNEAPVEEPKENDGALVKEIDLESKNMRNLFEKEELLYYDATSKTTGLSSAATLEEKQQIAQQISVNQLSAQKLTQEIGLMDISKFTGDQKNVYDKLKTFAESTEYYILLLENISYLAAQGQDYSMLADTFLYFAMDSQTKMEEARAAIQTLD